MRFEGPLYDGDSLIRSGPVFKESPVSTPERTPDEKKMLQRVITAEAGLGVPIDVAEIEAQARALRAAVVASWAARLGERLTHWLESARRRRDEAYLARSQNHAELESRIRELERRGYASDL
jgi:hypothetical protein